MKIGALAPAVARFLDEMSHSIRMAILHHFFPLHFVIIAQSPFFLPHINTFLLLLNCEFDGNVVEQRIQLLSLCMTPSVKCSMYNAICVYWSLRSINKKRVKIFNIFLFYLVASYMLDQYRCIYGNGRLFVLLQILFLTFFQ